MILVIVRSKLAETLMFDVCVMLEVCLLETMCKSVSIYIYVRTNVCVFKRLTTETRYIYLRFKKKIV